MASKFLFLFRRLNLSFLSEEKRSKVLEKSGFNIMKVVEIFEYEKSNSGY